MTPTACVGVINAKLQFFCFRLYYHIINLRAGSWSSLPGLQLLEPRSELRSDAFFTTIIEFSWDSNPWLAAQIMFSNQ